MLDTSFTLLKYFIVASAISYSNYYLVKAVMILIGYCLDRKD